MTGGQPLRLMLLVTSMEVGGAEQQARYLALAFRRRGWPVDLVSMVPLEHPESELDAAGVGVTTLGMRAGPPDLRGLWRLRSLLRSNRPDVVQSLMFHANVLGRVAHPLASESLVVSSLRTSNEGGAWRNRAYRFTNRLADATTAVSAEAAASLDAHGARPRDGVPVLPSGIDLGRFSPDPAVRSRVRAELDAEGSLLWLAVGRLTEAKAYPDMLTAFAKVAKTRPEARLVIAGPGPQLEALNRQVVALGLGGCVRLLGERDDIPDLLRAADAFVMSSAWEGLPSALLEAGASSLPIVATQVGGNDTIVADGVTGFLVPPSSPASLADGMLRVASLTPDERASMGAAARAHVQAEFGLEARIDAWEALYRDLLRRRRQRRGPRVTGG